MGFFDFVGDILPIAGTVVGGVFGGPAGAAIGGALGGAVGGAIKGGPDKSGYNLPDYQERRDRLLGAQGAYDPAKFRAGQENLITQLQDQAAGKGTSLAELNRQKAIQSASSVLGAARPGQEAAAMRNAQAATGNANAGAAQNALVERLGAQSMLGNTLSGARTQDEAALASLRDLELRNAGAQQSGTVSGANTYANIPTAGQRLQGGLAAALPYITQGGGANGGTGGKPGIAGAAGYANQGPTADLSPLGEGWG